MNKFNEPYHTIIMKSFDNDDAQVDELMVDVSWIFPTERIKVESII